MIRLHGDKYWLYDTVHRKTDEILHVSLLSTTTKRTTRTIST
jgi:hypothetical protein